LQVSAHEKDSHFRDDWLWRMLGPIAGLTGSLMCGYRFDTRWAHRGNYDAENLVVLAFLGRGTRAAAFSYGVLESSPRQSLRRFRNSANLPGNHDPDLAEFARVPDIERHVIDVCLPALEDKAEVEYLNNLPTSFVLPPEAVDRLRAAAKTIILSSPELKRPLEDADGVKLIAGPASAADKVAP
jgi:hypothetical protein